MSIIFAIRQCVTSALVERKAINVDKDNFDAALKGQNLTLTLSVPNCLDEKAAEDDLLNVSVP